MFFLTLYDEFESFHFLFKKLTQAFFSFLPHEKLAHFSVIQVVEKCSTTVSASQATWGKHLLRSPVTPIFKGCC